MILEQYQLNIKGHGLDALRQVNITVSYNGRNFYENGLATDILESLIKAMIHALNNIWITQQIITDRKNTYKIKNNT